MDDHTPMGIEIQDPLDRQLSKGLANGGGGGAHALGDIGLLKAGPGGQGSRQDLDSEPIRHERLSSTVDMGFVRVVNLFEG